MLLVASLHGKIFLLTPNENVTLGMQLEEFRRLYTVDTTCKDAPDKNTYTFIQTTDNLYYNHRLKVDKSYLTFLNGYLIQCYTLVKDSTAIQGIRTRLYVMKYRCISNAGGICKSFRRRKGKAVSCFLFGDKSLLIDYHTASMERHYVPRNRLLPEQ